MDASSPLNDSGPRIGVYTGSFDPVTLGHLNVIERAAALFDTLVVGVGLNVTKESLFAPEERAELLRQATAHLPGVEVRFFSGLAVHFVRACGARTIVRGIRPLTDLAGEFTMMLANRQLDREIDTVFLMADKELAHVSSSLIKQIAPHADESMLTQFLPAAIVETVRERILATPGRTGRPPASL